MLFTSMFIMQASQNPLCHGSMARGIDDDIGRRIRNARPKAGMWATAIVMHNPLSKHAP
jgi:hypothetical protein